jgi:tetratricopeptide (TPR) repeat protein
LKKHLRIFGLLCFTAVIFSACSAGRSGTGEKPKSGKKGVAQQESVEFQKYFFQGQERKSIGNYEAAYQDFTKCSEISPKNDAPWFELARIDNAAERMDRSLEHIKMAIKLNPKNYWYHQTHAQFLLDYGKFEEARIELEWLIKEHPEELDPYYDLAATYLYREDGKGAIKVYERLEARIGVDPELSFQKQRIYMLMGEPEKALTELDRLIDAYPEPEFSGHKAELQFELGRYEAAEQTVNQLLAMEASNGNALMLLSRILAREGKEDASWEALTKAFLSPDVSIDEKIGVLLRFFNASEFDEQALTRAYVLLEKLELVHPNDPKMHSMFGDYLLREGNLKGARDRFAQAVELDADRQLIWLQLTELDAELSDWTALTSHAEKAASLFPAQPFFYLMQGTGLLRQKRPTEAAALLQVGKSYVVSDDRLLGNFWSTLGEAYHESADHRRSDEAFDNALQLLGDDPFILNNYSYYLSIRGAKLDKAAEMSRKSNEIMPDTPSFQDTYGWILFRQGKHTEALDWVGKALKSTSGDAVLFEHYGDILFHLNRKEDALSYWKKAADAGDGSALLQKKIADRTYYNDLQP